MKQLKKRSTIKPVTMKSKEGVRRCFRLDPLRDIHARRALKAYAKSWAKECPTGASNLEQYLIGFETHAQDKHLPEVARRVVDLGCGLCVTVAASTTDEEVRKKYKRFLDPQQ